MSVGAAFEDDEPEPERRPGNGSDPTGDNPLRAWLDLGFTLAEARRWREDGFEADEAERWRAGGVYRPKQAAEWRTAGATPAVVDRWVRVGMTPRDAVRWREFGVSPDDAVQRHLAGEEPGLRGLFTRFAHRRSPRAAGRTLDPKKSEGIRSLLKAGISAETARGFVEGGWDGEEALPWARHGITPADALILHALGFTAQEAQRVTGDGTPAVDLMTRWWRAAVPIDDVAAWCGAGFTADEAAEQIKQGADVERAKVLRALTEEEL
jgi:hypothetical protein